MHAVILAFVSAAALAAVSAQAAPLPSKPAAIELSLTSPIRALWGA